MNKMSIKWKLSLALIASGLTLVVAYVFVAKKVFESDKISYVFDSQSSRLEAQKREIEQRFERALLTARSVIATYDPNRAALSSAGEQIFQEEKTLLALELWNEQSEKAAFHVEKTPNTLPASNLREKSIVPGHVEVSLIGKNRFLILLRYSQSGNTSPFRVRAVVQFKNLLPPGETHQSLMLLQQGRFIADSDMGDVANPAFAKLTQDIANDNTDKTMIWSNGSERFLVSTASVGIGGFRIVAMTPEGVALGALGTLFRRSLVFLAFSIFALIAVSLTLSKSLTTNLAVLTRAAFKIGQGDFEAIPIVKSQDEMGVLSGAITKMSKEIQRLLVETRDKARMESELKTASLVQESLLPSIPKFELNQLEVKGVALTSTECGGDWWYYFTKGDVLYLAIADATGHGTPAALITAAARSVFSRLQEEDLSLPQMMRSWDVAISSCSSGRVFMTGILMKINSKTGLGHYIAAGHESPLWIKQAGDTFEYDYLDLDTNKALGEGFNAKVQEQSFVLEPNCTLVLYTDGIFSVERPDGKKLSEKRFGKGLAAKAEFAHTAEDMLTSTIDLFEEHRQGLPLPDDVTIVSVRRVGPRSEVVPTADFDSEITQS